MAGKTKRVLATVCALAVFTVPFMSSAQASAQSKPLAVGSISAHSPKWLDSIKETAQTSTVEAQVEPFKQVFKPSTTIERLGNNANCNGTQLNIVAHQDDDILFMNPDLQESISNGICSRTVYLTAGDNGSLPAYWQERERGPQAAYAAMYNAPNQWIESTKLVAGQTVTEHRLVSDPRVSLLSLRLPDGNVSGTGFASTEHQSLEALHDGTLATITSVDGRSHYSAEQLVDTLRTIIELDAPQVLNTQAHAEDLAGGDHSDHQAVGSFTEQAAEIFRGSLIVKHYMAYQVNGSPSNLTTQEMAAKQAVFAAYSAHDSQVCNSVSDCVNDLTYLPYYSRQYLHVN